MTAQDKIQDEYTEHDVNVLKFSASLGRYVEREYTKLGRELSAMVRDVDPSSPAAKRFKDARVDTLDKRSKKHIRARVSAVHRHVKSELRRLGILETKEARIILERVLNGR